jgi:hypothetical protein
MLMKRILEGTGRRRIEERASERRERAFLYGASKISPNVTLRPMGIPRCVAVSRRGRRGQGQPRSSARRAGRELGGPEDMTQLLSLLTPRPEREEKRLRRERAGEMSETEREARATSSAKAKGRIPGRAPNLVRRGS